jgi:methyl-galactoside transport system permease protein
MNTNKLNAMGPVKRALAIGYHYTLGMVFHLFVLLGRLIVWLLTHFFRAYGKFRKKTAVWYDDFTGEDVHDADEEAKMGFFKRQWQIHKRKTVRNIGNYLEWSAEDTKTFLVNNAIYIVIFFLILIVIIQSPSFLSIRVFRNILTQSSVRLILAFGVGGIIILQGTDLSLGRSVGFAAIISASLLQAQTYSSRFYPDMPELPLILPLVIAMLVSAFFSAINGFVVAVFKIHPFLATLGASVALYGILSMYFASGAPGPQPIGGFDARYTEFVVGHVSLFGMEIPKLIIYAMIMTVIIWIIWNKTTFGKNMYAVGGNPEAAKISGVNVVKTTVLVYVMAGVLYGMGGFLEAARIGSASNGTGVNYELDAIAACVVGGISFSGGIGKVSGAVVGVLMFTIISYGMNFLGLDVFYQYIIKGVIIVAAVALDTRKYIKKT